MKTLDELVAESPVFNGLDHASLELIAGCGQNTVFKAGEYLFREGDQADTFYLVRRGRVQVQTFVPGRGAVTVDTVDAGDVIGWSWLFPPYRWRFDARALELVRAVAFDGACLRGKCADDNALGYQLMLRFSRVMVERLDATRMQLLEIHGSAA